MNFVSLLIKRYKSWQISLGLTIATVIITQNITYLGFFLLTDMENVEYSLLFAIILPLMLVPPFSYYFLKNLVLLGRTEDENKKLISELKIALESVDQLEGLIPICAECKKIRDTEGAWLAVEEFVKRHSHAEFSHGLCPDCAARMYDQLDRHKNKG